MFNAVHTPTTIVYFRGSSDQHWINRSLSMRKYHLGRKILLWPWLTRWSRRRLFMVIYMHLLPILCTVLVCQLHCKWANCDKFKWTSDRKGLEGGVVLPPSHFLKCLRMHHLTSRIVNFGGRHGCSQTHLHGQSASTFRGHTRSFINSWIQPWWLGTLEMKMIQYLMYENVVTLK